VTTPAAVLAYPHQIGDALWRVEAAGIPRRELPGGVAVCGVAHGAGALAAAILGDRAAAPVRDGLDDAAGEETFVLIASYSGDDQEALDCFEEAGRRRAPRAVVTTAGRLAARAREEGVPVVGVPAGFPDPSAAIVYFTVAALEPAAPSVRSELEAAVPYLLRVTETRDLGEPSTAAERVLGERLLGDLGAASEATWQPRKP
jgi:glucose/mannose-6-phosphate isomerase